MRTIWPRVDHSAAYENDQIVKKLKSIRCRRVDRCNNSHAAICDLSQNLQDLQSGNHHADDVKFRSAV